MTTSLDHVPTWDDIDNELEIDQQMGWQWVQHKARIGAMLIAKQGDMSLRQFIEAANRQRGAHLPTLKRATVNVYQNLHRHSALLEAKQPITVNEARRLIAAHNAPPVPVYRDRQPQPAPLSVPPVPVQRVGQPQPQAASAPQPQAASMPAGSAEGTRPAWSVTTEMRELAEWVETTAKSAPTYEVAAMALEGLFKPDPWSAFCLDLDQQYAVAKYLMDWWRIVRDPNIDSTVSVWMDLEDDDPRPDMILQWFPPVEMLDEIERQPR